MSTLLTKNRTMPPVLRRVLWIIGGVVGGLLALSVPAGTFMQARAVHEARKLTTFDSGFHPPDSTITCRGAVTTACTGEAARRIRLPVAWMPVPKGYHLHWVMAAGDRKIPKDHRTAEEMLTGGHIDMELITQPPGPWPGNERQVGTFTENGTPNVAFRERVSPDSPAFPAITYRWTHDGVQYQLWVAPHDMLDLRPIDPGAYAPLLAAVRYAEPPTRSRSHA